ncbi:MAG: nitroreductase [Desulfobacteraceae bacterium IS3]|nr:MAG: nitroreductase [Desulfobacteraceae bacterium IS3]
MAIPTSRTKIKAGIEINEEKCTGCGLCVSVCKDFSLKIENKKIRISDNPFFGCIGCGHCMAICPSDAIKVFGRTLSPDDLFDLPDKEKTARYEQLLFLLQRRRSIREFSDKPVDNDMIKKILDTAQTAPMGLPPSDVNVLVLDSKEKVRGFAKDFCSYLEGMKWFVSDWFLSLMRPFWGKANDELFRGFVKPLFHVYTENMKKGINVVNYDAPLAMYFYGSPYSDPADPIIAATYSMLAGETLGLGTCMLGGVHPLIQKGKKAARFRKMQGIKYSSQEGLFVIFGHPLVKYKKGILRTFASIEIKK